MIINGLDSLNRFFYVKNFTHLQKVHATVHDLQCNAFRNLLKKKSFSTLKISTGGGFYSLESLYVTIIRDQLKYVN
jgi:hypothetical protein